MKCSLLSFFQLLTVIFLWCGAGIYAAWGAGVRWICVEKRRKVNQKTNRHVSHGRLGEAYGDPHILESACSHLFRAFWLYRLPLRRENASDRASCGHSEPEEKGKEPDAENNARRRRRYPPAYLPAGSRRPLA